MSPFLFAVVANVVNELATSVLSELLYADDIVLVSETIDGPRNKFRKLKEAF